MTRSLQNSHLCACFKKASILSAWPGDMSHHLSICTVYQYADGSSSNIMHSLFYGNVPSVSESDEHCRVSGCWPDMFRTSVDIIDGLHTTTAVHKVWWTCDLAFRFLRIERTSLAENRRALACRTSEISPPMYSTPTLSAMLPHSEPVNKLYTSVINNDKHVLSHILPDPNNHTYNLRPRRHELTPAIKGDARNFFERQLFKDIILITTISYFVPHFLFTVLCCFSFLLCCCVLTADFTH